jgi:hypothetical protein
MPGKDNTVADAMSRYAYPASSSREDVSFHGSAQAESEVKKLIEREIHPASRTRNRLPPSRRGAAPLPPQSRSSTRGRRLARVPVPRQQSDSDTSESPPPVARRRARTAPPSSTGIPGDSFPTGELSGQGSTLRTQASANAEAGPLLMFNPPPLLPG